ncbi:MAG: biotin-dependent carboxyltransferase family protein [Lapillicoccus sp.]
MSALVVEAVRPQALVEDLGRPGHASIGVTHSGAADRRALRLANRLLGNAAGAPGIEVLLGGLAVRADGVVRVCVTGAPAPLQVDGRAAPLDAPVDLRDGQLLTMGMPPTGLRTYLAVRGGLDEPLVLGSASTDPTMGVGPAPLAPGRRLAVAAEPTGRPAASVDVAAPDAPPVTDVVLRVVLGPRDDWFAPAAVEALTSQPWSVTTESDRVGVRLTGPELDRAQPAHGPDDSPRELPSEGVVRGAVQVPHSGQPLVFLADHPTTGGYPVIAVVVDDDTDVLAQLRPGERVRFRRIPRGW